MSALLRVHNATKVFGGLVAVNDVSFAIEENSISAIIGPNGAGKTTLFNLVTGFLPLTEGSIKLGEAGLTGLTPFRVAACGVVRTFQLVRPFPDMTALENVMVGTHLNTSGGIFAGRSQGARAPCSGRSRTPGTRGRDQPDIRAAATS